MARNISRGVLNKIRVPQRCVMFGSLPRHVTGRKCWSRVGASQNGGEIQATSGELYRDPYPATLENPKSEMHPHGSGFGGIWSRSILKIRFRVPSSFSGEPVVVRPCHTWRICLFGDMRILVGVTAIGMESKRVESGSSRMGKEMWCWFE